MSKRKARKDDEYYNVKWAWVVYKLGIYSMNKGLFLPFGFFVIIFIWSIRLNPEDLSGQITGFFGLLKTGYILGYVLFVLALLGWAFHVKRQRKIHEYEMRRISEERNQLQEKLSNKQIESSEKGRKK